MVVLANCRHHHRFRTEVSEPILGHDAHLLDLGAIAEVLDFGPGLDDSITGLLSVDETLQGLPDGVLVRRSEVFGRSLELADGEHFFEVCDLELEIYASLDDGREDDPPPVVGEERRLVDRGDELVELLNERLVVGVHYYSLGSDVLTRLMSLYHKYNKKQYLLSLASCLRPHSRVSWCMSFLATLLYSPYD